MRSQTILPSFLDDIDEKGKSVYEFKKIKVLTLMTMVKEELGNTLTPKFLSHHQKELQTYYFSLEITNKYKKWTIIKRLNDLLKLQKHLTSKFKVPTVPIRSEKQLQKENLEEILKFYQIFLNILAKDPNIAETQQFIKFVQNYVPHEKKKMKIFKQLQLLKRAGGRHNESTVKKIFLHLVNWSYRFFTITSEGVYFTSMKDNFRIQEMIPFSEGFKLLYGEADTGYTYGIILNSAHRMLNIDAQNIFNLTLFVYWLKKAMKQNNFLCPKRFGSFANVREKCHSQFFVDGKDYFKSVYQSMLLAKREIYITGWMISPYFCLKRPDPHDESRFDRVIERIAKSGIKVHIIVYLEPKIALNIDSEFTEQYLQSLSPNIKVLRHPSYALIPFLWSHHEKMVIIDQKIAFMGGLDIGYGRFDDSRHLLTDVNEEIWKGVDYCNYRTVDILNPRNYEKSSINRQNQPRMPWHDVAVKVIGQSVIDLSRHFVQYWNYVNFQLNMDDRELLMYVGLNQEDIAQYQKRETIQNGKKLKSNQKINYESQQINPRFSRRISPQRIDQSDFHKNFFSQAIKLASFEESQAHQEEVKGKKQMLGQYSSELEVDLETDHEKQMEFYASHIKQDTTKESLKKLINNFKQKSNNILHSKWSRQGVNFQDLIVTQNKEDWVVLQGHQNHQFLRSASIWSLGLEEGHEERSILRGYVELIFHSKEFIYIENQFFISIENTVSKALIERIGRAYEKKQKFKVVVIIPSLPGFEGQIENEDAAVLRVQVHHIYNTICRGGKSIIENLSYISNLDDYIQFFTLRTHGVLNKVPITEIIYVHSKVMIVDDEKVIIGSANINDRSLLGTRDSEIAILIQDKQQTEVQIKKTSSKIKESQKKNKRKVKKLAHNLRKTLYMEHFGITEAESEDYHDEDVWYTIVEHADKNQKIYRTIFGIYPDNEIQTFKGIKTSKKQEIDAEKYQLIKNLIKGNAILFQKNFLSRQYLGLKPSQKEYFVPNINFT